MNAEIHFCVTNLKKKYWKFNEVKLNQLKQIKPQGLEFGISIQLQSASSQVGLG